MPLFQNESKYEAFHMKMGSACSFIFMQIEVIVITMVSHLDSLLNRGTRELGNGLLGSVVGLVPRLSPVSLSLKTVETGLCVGVVHTGSCCTCF